MRTSQQAKTISVIFAAAMAITALVLNSVTSSKMSDSILSVRQAIEVKVQWQRLLSLVRDTETSQMGFLLTGENVYLKPYTEAKETVPRTLTILRELDVTNPSTPSYAKDLEDVAQWIAQRMDFATEAILVRKREGSSAAVASMMINRDLRLMEKIRDRILEVMKTQQDWIDSRTVMMQRDLKWGYISALSTGFVALLAGVIALFLIRDSAQQSRREGRLAAEKRRAEESDRQKSSFLATMSHEIRTPMNAILGFGELLESEVTTGKQKHYIQAILVGGRSLLQLINDILDLSKIEAGMTSIKPEPMDLRDLGQFVRQIFTQQAVGKGVALEVEIAENVPHSLLLDSVRLRQILINIVGNALKFTERGSVTVRFLVDAPPAKRGKINLKIEIEDTGQGIPEAQQNEVFKPFVQGAVQDSSAGSGTGLGLSIVKRLVELMGGTVTLHSTVGLGSTFQLYFPGVEISARLPQTRPLETPEVNFNNLRASKLLITDDNEANRDLVKGIFEKTHHQVTFASNGEEAVTAVLAEKPDVVLMDIRMPGMSGREALQAVRAWPEFNLLPIIAVTASSLSSEERDLRRAFDGYIRKPFSQAELHHELAQFIPKIQVQVKAEKDVLSEVALEMTPALISRWRQLIEKLREIERDVWPDLNNSMVMSEVGTFGENLKQLAIEADCPVLKLYADKLSRSVESFSLSVLEQYLAEFPACIDVIERRILLS